MCCECSWERLVENRTIQMADFFKLRKKARFRNIFLLVPGAVFFLTPPTPSKRQVTFAGTTWLRQKPCTNVDNLA